MLTFAIVLAAAALLVKPHAMAAEAAEGVHVVISEEEVVSDLPIYLEDGSLYAPLRFISERFGAQLHWNNERRQVEIVSPHGDTIVYTIGKYTLQVNGKNWITDVAPFIDDDRSYLPLRSIAEWMHADVTWDKTAKTANFEPKPLYTVQENDTLASIAEKFGLRQEWIKEINGLASNDELAAGAILKVVVPSVVRNREANEDMYLLAKLIDAEAGDEPLTGQIAVGNVVMNRVKSDLFPDTIRGVIYAPGQFTPAQNGMLDGLEPRESAVIAAKKALSGETPAKEALYFFNPKNSSNEFLESLSVVANIGHHRFAK